MDAKSDVAKQDLTFTISVPMDRKTLYHVLKGDPTGLNVDPQPEGKDVTLDMIIEHMKDTMPKIISFTVTLKNVQRLRVVVFGQDGVPKTVTVSRQQEPVLGS